MIGKFARWLAHDDRVLVELAVDAVIGLGIVVSLLGVAFFLGTLFKFGALAEW